MNFTISARNFDLTETLTEFAQKKLRKLERYFNYIIDGHLVLEKDKGISIVELVLLVKHSSINSKVRNHDIYLGIGEVVKKIERQLQRYEAKFKERKRLSRKGKKYD